MDARVILERMVRRYRQAECYEDHGVHRIDADDEPLVSKFSTEYSRTHGLRFRFVNKAMDVVADADGQLRKARGLAVLGGDLVEILGMGAGATFLTSAVVPPLFFPRLFAGDAISDSGEPRWRGWELVEGESCHVLDVKSRGTAFELLVSEKGALVRAFRRPRPLQMFATYHPRLIPRSNARTR